MTDPQVGFVTQRAATPVGDVAEIGIGMLGYAFMGKRTRTLTGHSTT